MSMTEQEAKAGLKVLVAVAKADGTVTEDERAALQAMLQELPVVGTTIEALLSDTIQLEAELEQLRSPEARSAVYRSAFSIARADGQVAPAEQALLDRIKKSLKIDSQAEAWLEKAYGEAKDTVLLSNIQPIQDPALRDKEIRADVIKYSIGAGVLGAFPIPGLAVATDLASIALQVKLIRDVGQYYGHKTDDKAARSLLAGLGLGTGVRIALNNLAKLVPGWGSVFGAATNFGSTWAIGRIAVQYFESGGKLELSVLRDAYAKAVSEGKAEFKKYQGKVEQSKQTSESQLAALAEQLQSGAITRAEYEQKVTTLLEKN